MWSSLQTKNSQVPDEKNIAFAAGLLVGAGYTVEKSVEKSVKQSVEQSVEKSCNSLGFSPQPHYFSPYNQTSQVNSQQVIPLNEDYGFNNENYMLQNICEKTIFYKVGNCPEMSLSPFSQVMIVTKPNEMIKYRTSKNKTHTEALTQDRWNIFVWTDHSENFISAKAFPKQVVIVYYPGYDLTKKAETNKYQMTIYEETPDRKVYPVSTDQDVFPVAFLDPTTIMSLKNTKTGLTTPSYAAVNYTAKDGFYNIMEQNGLLQLQKQKFVSDNILVKLTLC